MKKPVKKHCFFPSQNCEFWIDQEAGYQSYDVSFSKLTITSMSIAVKDFAPDKVKGNIFHKGSIEEFDPLMEKINEWIKAENPSIINIETVLLPNMYDDQEHGSMDTELWTGGGTSTQWYQVIRVWYSV